MSLFFQGRSGSCLLFAPMKHAAGLLSQADSCLITACWICPVVLEYFEQDCNILLISLSPRPLSFARVQVNYSIVLCLSQCLCTSALVVSSCVIPSALIKRNPFKTPEVWEALFTTWIKGLLSKGLWNTIWTKIFHFNMCVGNWMANWQRYGTYIVDKQTLWIFQLVWPSMPWISDSLVIILVASSSFYLMPLLLWT